VTSTAIGLGTSIGLVPWLWRHRIARWVQVLIAYILLGGLALVTWLVLEVPRDADDRASALGQFGFSALCALAVWRVWASPRTRRGASGRLT
jgi:hypothetical protein